MKDPNIPYLQEYIAHDIDTAGDTKYYGFLCPDGRWVITREITSAGSYRYSFSCCMAGTYQTNWTNRAALMYGYITQVS